MHRKIVWLQDIDLIDAVLKWCPYAVEILDSCDFVSHSAEEQSFGSDRCETFVNSQFNKINCQMPLYFVDCAFLLAIWKQKNRCRLSDNSR
uniref:Uncharacterized protein n=1 Tax=Arundo donax TaxID=35708 RepID=A0A0A9FV57_ARUDO